MNQEQQLVEAQVVKLTRMAHPTDQGKATGELEDAIRGTLEAMVTYGETKAQREVEAHGFGNIKSGKKLAKKLRQAYGRELHDAAQDRTKKLYKTFEEHIRPQPRFVPTFAWRLIQRIVLQHYV